MCLNLLYLADRPVAVPQVCRWWFDEWGPLRPDDSLEELISRVHRLSSRERPPITIVAVLEDAVVGTAVLKLHEMFDLYPDKRFWLGSVFVAPEFRGRGIGSALANKILDIARSQRVPAVHLQTQNLNGGLYAKLGWEPIEQVHYRGYDALVMVKRLVSD